jgi:hypothetical protein
MHVQAQPLDALRIARRQLHQPLLPSCRQSCCRYIDRVGVVTEAPVEV